MAVDVIVTLVALAVLFLLSEVIVRSVKAVRRWRVRRFLRQRLTPKDRYSPSWSRR